MLDIVFVILNYNVYQETIDCVESIKKNIDTDKYRIIIVDNLSPNNTGELLRKFFSNDMFVTVVINEENLGFARGNNVGISYARKYFNAKYICCLNNDTLLEKNDFYQQVNKCFKEEKPAVIGPKIILKNGNIQRVMGRLMSIDEYKTQMEFYQGKFSQKIKKCLLEIRIIKFVNVCRHRLFKNKNISLDVNCMNKDIILHGSCLIFTPVFFLKADGFDSRTFMFREEELLFICLKKLGLHNLYNPNLEIRHLEDVSTDSVYVGTMEKNKFLYDNQVKSLQILIDELSH